MHNRAVGGYRMEGYAEKTVSLKACHLRHVTESTSLKACHLKHVT